eukprot:CAMPEP_0184304340 /NCGR_PEP_ID=MMETSP1049-20130417/13888_1 /TAXON_ID=77928 /ORGANISM="Proteomonas sulcata, Strain CCMP704" /LENGTH=200 /DNA_ID=CAMNT_0026616129 /DNA_START=13 /DNA_END=612 /DNA_ORIENTATION=+
MSTITSFYGIDSSRAQTFDPKLVYWSSASLGKRDKMCLVSPSVDLFLRESWFPSVSDMPTVRRKLRHFGQSAFWPVRLRKKRSPKRSSKDSSIASLAAETLHDSDAGEQLCTWGIIQEAAPLLAPHMQLRCIDFLDQYVFADLLKNRVVAWEQLNLWQEQGRVRGMESLTDRTRKPSSPGGLLVRFEAAAFSCTISDTGE